MTNSYYPKLTGAAVAMLALAAQLVGSQERRVALPPPSVARPTALVLLDEAGQPLELGRVVGMAWLSDSLLAVADGQAQNVRVFDRRGRQTAIVGRGGSGPGEFRNLVAVHARGDTLVATEAAPGPSRVHAFQSRGRFLFVRALNRPDGALRVLGGFGDGTLLVTRDGMRAVTPPQAGESRRDSLELGLLRQNSELTWTANIPNNTWIGVQSPIEPSRQFLARQPFGPSLFVAVASGVAWLGDSETGIVRAVSSSGSTIGEFRVDVERHRFSELWIAEARNRELAAGANPMVRARVEAVYQRATLPARRPAFVRMLAGDNSDVWVELDAAGADQARAFLVLSSGLSTRALVRLPRSFVPHAVRGHRVAGVQTADDGSETVALYEFDLASDSR